MNRLSSGLLTLKKEWIEASDIVQSAITQLKIKNRKIEIIELTPNNFLYCDGLLLEHAILNLLLNAISYSPPDTIIKIEIELVDDKVFLRVLDLGNGIPNDKFELIFDKFYRLPQSPTGGVGLGLSIVKGIVEAHNGNVSAKNRIDQQGAMFTIELPWIKPPRNFGEEQT
jgi:two-component system sensor histidine kinase KdpD